MIHLIHNNTIVQSWQSYPKVVDMPDGSRLHAQYELKRQGVEYLESQGLYREQRQSVDLGENEYISGYNDPVVIDGKPVRVPVVATKTQEIIAAERAEAVDRVIAERYRRLSLGLDYDFGDSRGVHRISTTEDDHKGWDKVAKLASAALFAGLPGTLIDIETDTGAVQVTAAEWQQITLAVALWEQPIWHYSFALQAMNPIPENYTDEVYWSETVE